MAKAVESVVSFKAWRGPKPEEVRTIAERVAFPSHFAHPERDPWGVKPALTLDIIWRILRPETNGRRTTLENRALAAYLRHMTSTCFVNGKLAFRLSPLEPFEQPASLGEWVTVATCDPLVERVAELYDITPAAPVRAWVTLAQLYDAVAPGRVLSQAEKRAIGCYLAMNGARRAKKARAWSITTKTA